MDLAFSLEAPSHRGKVERSNQTLKQALAKQCQETQESWIKLLPIVLLRTQLAPRDKFSAFDSCMVDPIPQAREEGHFNPPEIEQLKYALQVGATTKALTNMVTRCCLHPPTWPCTRSGQETGRT